MQVTSKRHPLKARYRAAIKDGRITALDVDLRYNSGGYSTLSAVVLQRGTISCNGVYDIPNQRVSSHACKTNTVPNGAFRGFGAPQVFFAMEMFMDHVAAHLGVDTLEFRRAHLAKKGSDTSTHGKYHFDIPLEDMIKELDEKCDYSRKHALYAGEQTGRYRRGIGVSMFFHGCGFTGNGERDFIKAVVKLQKYADGTVEILAANGEIGQGLRTTFPKIVAQAAGVPLEKVFFAHPDSGRVPDSGPTVASRSIMASGELLRRAALRLREEWIEGEDQLIEEHYKHPEFLIPFDIETFTGDSYPTFAWGANCVEVCVDTLTGEIAIENATGAFDLGTPIDYNIVVGQMEGGYLQALGQASIESIAPDGKGYLPNSRFSDYLIPTAADVPHLEATLHEAKYPSGPFGAKGGGELPCVGATAAYTMAMQQALATTICRTPFNAEDVMKHQLQERVSHLAAHRFVERSEGDANYLYA
jgi:CO/xanthine dehydrogenase Mo-binding subunit